MKKFIKILLFMILMIPLKTKAATGNINLRCPSVASKNQNISCSITASSTDGKIIGYEGTLNLSEGITCSNAVSSTFSSVRMSNSKLLADTGEMSSGETIMSFTCTINASGTQTISISQNKMPVGTIDNPLRTSPADVSAQIVVKSDNNNLTSLGISSGTLSPAFSTSVTNYTASTDSSSVTVSATKESDLSSIEGAKTYNLNYGNNILNVVVTAEDGSKKTYTITMVRNDNRNNDNTLKKLTISSGSISFDKNVTNYSVLVDGSVNNVSVTGIVNNNLSKINYSPSSSIELSPGEMKSIVITVTAENGTTKSYTVNITRKDTRSANNNLSKLEIKNQKLNFKKNAYTYILEVENDISSVIINATPEDTRAKVTGVGNTPLKEGSNLIYVTVTAENGSKKTYTINVIRKSLNNENKDDNNYLSSLTINGIIFKFDKEKTSYVLGVPNSMTNATIINKTESDKAVLEVSDTALAVGNNIINIKVTSEKGTIRTYTLYINRERESLTEIKTIEDLNKKIQENSDKINIKFNENEIINIDKNTLNTLKSNNKSLNIDVVNEEGGIVYSFELLNTNISNPDIIFNPIISFSLDPESKINNFVKDKEYVYLNLSHNGVFPGKMKLKVFVGDEFLEGTTVYLNYFNNNELEYVESSSEVINGYATFELNHASEYVILAEKIQLVKISSNESTLNERNITKVICAIVSSLIVVIEIIILVITIKKRKKNK